MSKLNELLPQLSEEDNLIPTIRVIIMSGGEVQLNKLVSRKANIKEILTNHNLDPDKTYIMDDNPVDVEKTILEIIPESKAHLTEAELIIETLPLDLEIRHEIKYDPVLKPVERPFRIYAFSPKSFDITLKNYSKDSIKRLKLEYFSDDYSGYCNTPKDLYISGGKNGGKGTNFFWKINKQNFGIEKLRDLKFNKEQHTMFFVPKKYVFFIGGNSQEVYVYNILKDDFEAWGKLKKRRIKPCVALANRCYIYAFDNQPEKNNFEFIERTNLAKGREWDIIKVALSQQFPLTNFSSAVDVDNKIYLFGGNKKRSKEKELCYIFNTKEKSLVPFEQENSSMTTSDKTFYPINEFNSALIPNFEGDKLNVLVFNRRKRRFKRLKFNPEVEKQFEIKDLTNDKNNDDKMRLLLKKVEAPEKMPDLPEGLIKFPTPEELNAPSKIEPEIKVDIKGPSLNIEQPNIEGEIGIPGIDIHGPKIDAGIDIKGPKIGGPGINAEIGLPGIGVDAKGPNIDGNINADVDINIPQVNLRGPKPKIGGPGLNVHGPKISGPGIGVDIHGPKIGGPGLDIKGPDRKSVV